MAEAKKKTLTHVRSVESIADLPLEDAIREKLESSKELNIVIVGCYQVGKSTLINSLFFEKGKKYRERAEEGSMGPRHLVQHL